MNLERDIVRDDTVSARAHVRELLREALDAQQGGRSLGDALQLRTRAACECAHGLGLPIERLLVLLKEEWRDTPDARRLTRVDATSVLERVVTLCINEFYADRPRH